MTRVRALSDGTSTYTTTIDGPHVTVTSGRPGRERTTTKDFADAGAALAWAEGQERARLRKGFTLVADSDAVAPGEPVLTIALERAYTGMLPLAQHDGALVTAHRDGDEDIALAFDLTGQPNELARTPALISAFVSTPAGLLALADHRVWRVAASALEPLTARHTPACSVLGASGSRVVWHQSGRLEVVQLAGPGEVLWTTPVEPELFHGHTPVLCAALGDQRVAWSAGGGIVTVRDLATGDERVIDGFVMPAALAFWGDHLIVGDLYAHARYLPPLRVFDSAGAPFGWWTPPGPAPHAFAVSPDGTRLAVSSGPYGVTIHRFGEPEPELSFRVDHVARRAELAWLDDARLGVRVDAGFLGVIRVR